MRLNYELVERARKGEIAILNDGSVEELNVLLRQIWPEDNKSTLQVQGKYFRKDPWFANRWFASLTKVSVTYSVKDFYMKDTNDQPQAALTEPVPIVKILDANIRIAIVDAMNAYRSQEDRETIPAKAFQQIAKKASEVLVKDLSQSLFFGREKEVQGLVEALGSILEWDLPATGKFWDREGKDPISYRAAFGVDGEKDVIRNIARNALARFLNPELDAKVSAQAAAPDDTRTTNALYWKERCEAAEDVIRAKENPQNIPDTENDAFRVFTERNDKWQRIVSAGGSGQMPESEKSAEYLLKAIEAINPRNLDGTGTKWYEYYGTQVQGQGKESFVHSASCYLACKMAEQELYAQFLSIIAVYCTELFNLLILRENSPSISLEKLSDAHALAIFNSLQDQNTTDESKIYQMKDLLTTNRFYNEITNIPGNGWWKIFSFLLSKGYYWDGLSRSIADLGNQTKNHAVE